MLIPSSGGATIGTVCGTGIEVMIGGVVKGEGGELRSTEPMLECKLGPLPPLLPPSRLDRREMLGGGVREALGCSLCIMMESLRPIPPSNAPEAARPEPADYDQRII